MSKRVRNYKGQRRKVGHIGTGRAGRSRITTPLYSEPPDRFVFHCREAVIVAALGGCALAITYALADYLYW